MTDMIQMCSNFHRARVFITNTRPDEISLAASHSAQIKWLQEQLAAGTDRTEQLPMIEKNLNGPFCEAADRSQYRPDDYP